VLLQRVAQFIKVLARSPSFLLPRSSLSVEIHL
jgi:hypothetical protein